MLDFRGIVQVYQFWKVDHLKNGGMIYQWLVISPRSKKDILVTPGKAFNGYLLSFLDRGTSRDIPNLPNGMVTEVWGKISCTNGPQWKMDFWNPQLWLEGYRLLFQHQIPCNIPEHLRQVGWTRNSLPSEGDPSG